MTFSQIKELDQTYIAGTYARNDLLVQQGKGATCQDDTSRPLIDFSSGIGVNSIGYGNPAWVQAVKEQIDKLSHISNLYYTEPMARLAEALCKRTGMKKVFFANSGAEANEGAIKTARKYMSDHYNGERDTILTLVNSFHGRTIATLAATGQDTMHRHFGPFPQGFVHAKANDIADLNAKLTDRVGAILLECVQGEGGVIPLEQEFVDAVTDACRRRDILLMVDEVQTGVGRTGKFLALEHFGIQPDVVTLAKGLGGGLPIGAVLFGEKTQDVLGKGDHGSTFGGNPVCCAGARAVLELMDDTFLARVAETGDYLRKRLEAMPGIVEVTGKGMMLGATLREGLKNTDVIAACGREGLILLPAKHKLRFLPPLTISREELDTGLAILEKVLTNLTNQTDKNGG